MTTLPIIATFFTVGTIAGLIIIAGAAFLGSEAARAELSLLKIEVNRLRAKIEARESFEKAKGKRHD